MAVDEILKALIDKGFIREAGVMKPNRRVYEFKPNDLRSIISFIHEKYGVETFYLSTLVGTDLPDKGLIRIDYYIVFLPEEETVVFRTFIPRDKPEIDSIIDLVPGALSGECETYDLLGVVFRGNNALKRGFFVPEDLVEQGIYPLRKDAKV